MLIYAVVFILLYVTITKMPAAQIKMISIIELERPSWDVVEFLEAETKISCI